MKLVRRHLLVTGRVQNVGFRFFSRCLALRFRLAGWVRNLPDGTVELEVQGPPERVDAFLRRLKQGTRRAVVASVTLTGREPEPGRSFCVLR